MPYNFDITIDRRQTNSVKWTIYDEDVLPMWVADMDFPVPRPVLDALRKALDYGVLGYEFPQRRLFETVARRMHRLYDWQIGPDDVVAIPGLVTGFNVAARIVCQPGDGILVQPPVYFPFLNVHKNLDLVRQDAPLQVIREGNRLCYGIDWDVFEAAVHSNGAQTGMFLLCNPHNPTGQAYSHTDLTRMAEICLENDIMICSDEIHSELLLGETKHIPVATLSPEIAARTITLVAASKTFNVAGLFTGFAIIENESLRRRFVHEIERQTLHVNSLGLIAAEAALNGSCDTWLADLNAYLTANRDFAVEYVGKYFPNLCITFPDATYLAWLDCSDLLDSGKITGSPHKFFLEQAKVALNDGDAFGPGGEGFVRLNFGCPRATLEEGLERMRKALI